MPRILTEFNPGYWSKLLTLSELNKVIESRPSEDLRVWKLGGEFGKMGAKASEVDLSGGIEEERSATL